VKKGKFLKTDFAAAPKKSIKSVHLIIFHPKTVKNIVYPMVKSRKLPAFKMCNTIHGNIPIYIGLPAEKAKHAEPR